MVACVGALTIYLLIVGQESYLAALNQGAEAQAKLVREAVLPYLSPSHSLSEVDGLAKRLGHESGVRVTIISPRGVVLGDSESDPVTMENHANRPEVLAALGQGFGESSRRSATVGYDALYVAVPIEDGGQLLGVARVAVPLEQVNRAAANTTLAIILGGLVAIGLAVGLAFLIARSMARPINQLTEIAGLMAEGHLDRRVGIYSKDEIGQLSR